MNQYLVVGVVFLVVIALLATNKKLVETLKNIYKIEELRKRVIYTIGLLLVYRLGSFVVIPGINPNALDEGSAYASQLEGNGLLGLLDVFSGGAFGNAAIFALGVMPYITASIIIQLMGMMVPYFQKMQKEGESGRRKMNQWTRFLTIGVLILQGPAYIANLYHQVPTAFVYGNSFGFVAYATTILIAGTMFIMWLGEKITDKGIGNGISLIIMIGIVARLPACAVGRGQCALPDRQRAAPSCLSSNWCSCSSSSWRRSPSCRLSARSLYSMQSVSSVTNSTAAYVSTFR